jgi:hypothetical protein
LRRWNTLLPRRRRTSRSRQTPTDDACPPDARAKSGGRADAPGLLRPLDEQEARLLERLRAARGEPVSFEELRAEGIETPGQLCYDLEIAGVPIVHVDRREHGRVQRVGILLAEPHDADAEAPVDSNPEAEAQAVTAATPVPVGAAALTLIAVLLATLALTDPGGSPTSPPSVSVPPRAPDVDRAAAPQRATRPSPHPQHAAKELSRGASAPRTRAIQVSPTKAAQVQRAGHQLLAQNDFAGAIRAMRTAIAASGQSLSGCRVPATGACLTYAYALYDLGRALRLAGRPAAAVGVLEARLQIDNQRPVVANELGLARAQLRQRRS